MALSYADYESEALQDVDFVRDIVLVEQTQSAPIYAALVAKGMVPTMTPEFRWATRDMPVITTKINNAADDYTAATTSIVVDDASVFFPSSLILFEATGEVGLVTAVNAGSNTLTVARGVGSTIAAADASVADNADVRQIGSAMGEGQSSPAFRKTVPTKVENYTQIFREPIEFTGTANASSTKPEYGRGRERAFKLREVIQQIERTVLFGLKDDDTVDADGKIVRTSGGLYESISTNVKDVGGNLTEAVLMDFLQMAGQFGSGQKLLFGGGTFIGYLSRIFSDRLQFARLSDRISLNVAPLVGPDGTEFLVATNRQMKGAFAADAVVIDPEQATWRGLGDERGNLRIRENIHDPEFDGTKDEWLTEAGLEYGAEETHARIEGITGVA